MSLGVSVNQRIEFLKNRFHHETLLIGDVGGGTGGLAGEINRYEGFEAFVIDKFPIIPKKCCLPLRRFIIADAESMSEIPNNTFHYLVSFNTIYYTDISKSVPECYRILRHGGLADFDWEFPNEEQLRRLTEGDIYKCISGDIYFQIGRLLTGIIYIQK